MKVLFLASEVAPFSKTGGLGDVAGALPARLAKRGVEVKVVTPLHTSVPRAGLQSVPVEVRLRFPFGEERASVRRASLSARHEVLFLEHPGYFDRPGIYGERAQDYPDNYRRYGFFSMGALQLAQKLGWNPDVVHLNDWQCGFAAPALAKGLHGISLPGAQSVFTIHNQAYQGLAPKSAYDELGLPWDLYMEGFEFYGQLSQLKPGLVYSNAITTVSKRYAEEICTAEGGWGLDGLLRGRRAALHGILNGVDYDEWNPSADPHLPETFDAEDLSGKAICKREVLRKMGLPKAAEKRPLFAVVSRLAEQKGIDILLFALQETLREPMSFVLLGNGEPQYEAQMESLQAAHPEKVAVRIGFDEALAHQIEAGADFFLMPSAYEPCGLNQMYSLRYGTVPIVRATGGLDDTVIDVKDPAGNGFKFGPYSASALAQAIRRALALYPKTKELEAVRRRGMKADFSWERAAGEYEALYQSLSRPPRKPPTRRRSAPKKKAPAKRGGKTVSRRGKAK